MSEETGPGKGKGREELGGEQSSHRCFVKVVTGEDVMGSKARSEPLKPPLISPDSSLKGHIF